MESSLKEYSIEGALIQPDQIVEGAEYIYTKDFPKNCTGCRYRVLKKEIVDVPSYQKKALIEALDGPDKGLWFTVTKANFCVRYSEAPKV